MGDLGLAGDGGVPIASRSHLFGNEVLRAFGEIVAARILQVASIVSFEPGAILSPHDRDAAVYFPESGALAVVVGAEQGACGVSACVAGPEDAIGLVDALARRRPAWRCEALLSGHAWGVPAGVLAGLVATDPISAAAAWRAAAQASARRDRVLACGALHSGSKRLAALLLDWADRVADRRVPLTHEKVSLLLGIKRTTVTVLLRQMFVEGLVDTGRGRVTLLDRARLAEQACGCWRRAG